MISINVPIVVDAPVSAIIAVSINCAKPLWLLNVPSNAGNDPSPALITVAILFIKLFTFVLAAPSPLFALVYCVYVVCLLLVYARFCKTKFLTRSLAKSNASTVCACCPAT